ncbi:neuralized-like protein 4 isoform X1 [Ischnura elegans]|uniref:neuralized-like protein 4 isoform X1 n=1 Tax=Ischnura elegans TaxID=197161 RepID=UPI001ED88586|nr:neuralized-like protein 4 isoform X1 [Ischnura elegans]
MKQWAVFTCIVLLTLQFASARGESDGSCPINTARRNVLKVSYDRRLNNSDGQWTTAFSARTKDASKSTADLKMEATHNVVECGENREIHVEILVKDGHENQTVEKRSIDNGLRFHHRHGPNVVVFNGGLSAQRINLENVHNAAVFTNRPLTDNELFEVRLDKRYTDKSRCHGIGIMAHSPDDVKFYESMYTSGGTWIYYDVNVYGENKVVVPNYGANVCNTKVGETIGVMKRDNGSLHFFVNGIDQGPAISNAPSVVYGVYEVRGFAAIATIINKDG